MSEKQLTLRNIAQWAKGTLVGEDRPIIDWAIDSRKVNKGDLFVAIRGARADGHDFIPEITAAGAAACVVSQPIDSALPYVLVEDTVKALGDIARKWTALCDIPVIAVTGSVGKTTTKSLMAAIMAQHHHTLATPGNFNSEIGLPLSLLKLNATHQSVVLEMGAGRRGDIAYLCDVAQPNIAVITRAAAVHVATFGSIDDVAKTKGEIYEGLRSQGVAIINADDPFASYWKGLVKDKTVITVGLENKADVFASQIQDLGLMGSDFVLHLPNGESLAIHMPFPGRHNVQNALAAAAAAYAAEVPIQTIKQGIERAENVGGRLQVKTVCGYQIIDDSYNANPTSLRAAIDVLSALTGEKILVTGDMLELGPTEKEDHFNVGCYAKEKGVRSLFGYGLLSQETVRGFGEGATHYASHDALAAALRAMLTQQSVVLVKGSRGMKMEKVIEALAKEGTC